MVGQLTHDSMHPAYRDAASRIRHSCRNVTRQWVRLVVVNAFVAFGVSLALHVIQQFALTHLLWQLLAGIFRPVIHALMSLLPGAGFMTNLAAWYGENQLKFAFWLLYSAAICDDLGLPNYKTLGRAVGRWLLLRLSNLSRPAAA
jgi:hypothetical protein